MVANASTQGGVCNQQGCVALDEVFVTLGNVLAAGVMAKAVGEAG